MKPGPPLAQTDLTPTVTRGSGLRIAAWAVPLMLIVAARIAWLAATGYTAEDSLILFRFARNIAAGAGYAFNPGEPVYGSTTPLFTLALAGLRTLGLDLFFAARALDLAAATAAFAMILRMAHRQAWLRGAELLLLGVFAVSAKSIQMDTQGMEWPLVLMWMAVSWDCFSRARPVAAGLAAGLLLWTRIDGAVWVLALAAGFFLQNRRSTVQFLATAAIVYLPWCAYAAITFESLLPLTITAKWVAFGSNQPVVAERTGRLLAFLSPLDFGVWFGQEALYLPAWITGGVIAFLAAAFIRRIRRRPESRPLAVFLMIQPMALIAGGATYQFRYAYPLVCLAWILSAAELAARAREWRARMPRIQGPLRAAAAALGAALLATGIPSAALARAVQQERHEKTLRAVGEWLREHASPDDIILLEPLGYAGYYSERRMVDEVGLVSPRIVDWKAAGWTSEDYVFLLRPEYTVLHCDDGLRMEETRGLGDLYARAASFNPLLFDPRRPPESVDEHLARGACYEIWRRWDVHP